MSDPGLDPRYAQADACRKAGDLAVAKDLYEQILTEDATQHPALYFLSAMEQTQGQYPRAEAYLNQALVLAPAEGKYYFALGLIHNAMQRHEAAIAAFCRASERAPDWPAPYYRLAPIYHFLGRYGEAIASLRAFLALCPDHFDALWVLGKCLRIHGQPEAALAVFRQAAGLRPDLANLYSDIGVTLRQLGALQDADLAYSRAIDLDPGDAAIHSAYLNLLSYHVLRSPQAMLEAHRLWDQRHGVRHVNQAVLPKDSDDDGLGHRLRIAYLSPDLHEHAISFFMEPLLAGHDHEHVEVFCYADVAHPDVVTERLRGYCDVWHSVIAWDDERLAQQIHDDGIDVLIDLLGHTFVGNGRMRVFAAKPARVQVSYLGYFASTGLSAMDYWISDAILTPMDTVERASETIWRLPRCCLAYQAPRDAPEVVPRSGPLMLGCFNNIVKAGEAAYVLWARVMNALPEARLVLKSSQFSEARVTTAILDRFSGRGVSADRIIFLAKTETIHEHLACYREIDIALDTLPRTGGTTTAEALWMGVPVVTLAGGRFIERLSATMLQAVGCDDWITGDEDSYVARVVALARDRDALDRIRMGLRDKMRRSVLCDGQDLAQAMESAYRAMWRACRHTGVPASRGVPASGDVSGAMTHFRRLLDLSPGDLDAANRLGSLLRQTKAYGQAIACYRQALTHAPDDARTIFNLAIVLHADYQLDEAEACYRQILARYPEDAQTWAGLGLVMKEGGQVMAARDCALRSLQIQPGNAEVHSNLLFVESYHVLCPPEALLAHHRGWAHRFAPDKLAGRYVHSGSDDADRCLRIGYVSPDLRRHPVGTFVEDLLAGHSPGQYEVYCYAETLADDAVSRRLKGYAKGWRITLGNSDASVAQQIHDDRIDILVDLAGHTRGHRLGVFARRPAPIQVTYLGYCTTTGLTAMDYWLTDAQLTPEDTVEQATETLWRLPRCWICYHPEPSGGQLGGDGDHAPHVAIRDGQGPVTFGCFNDLSKLSDAVVAVWAEILQRLPDARLLLKAAQLGNEQGRRRLALRFAEYDIAPDRLILRDRSPDYLLEYADVDIALDPFPRTGGVTTADALWMGVPVITLAGARMIERQGMSLLYALGLTCGIAHDTGEYIAKAVALARDPVARTQLRSGLREQMLHSALCDSEGLALAIEVAYRQMWIQYIESGDEPNKKNS